MLTVQQILKRHFDSFAAAHRLPTNLLYAAGQMRACRTDALGGQLIVCPYGCTQRILYHSCRHRSCPQCSTLSREKWLSGWKARLLDCPHFHTVFTTPHELLPLWRYNKSCFSNLLFAAATGSLRELLADKKYLGGRVGMLAALHTWTQTLAEHVHLHVLVTGGGMTPEGTWQSAKKSCLLPRKVLMIVFRGTFRRLLLEALKRGELRLPPHMNAARARGLLNKAGRQTWNVKILQRYDHGLGVATYLARYLKGGPISNRRLLRIRQGRLYFRYRERGETADAGHGRKAITSLEVHTFLRRLLEHIPPKGFHTVRGYGLYASNRHSRLDQARAALGQAPRNTPLQPSLDWQELCDRLGYAQTSHCPECGRRLESHCHFPRGRAPPQVKANVLNRSPS